MQADVIIVVYSMDVTQSWENVQSKWIPLIMDITGDGCNQKPIVVVGNKLDLQQNPTTINKSTNLYERAESLLEEYPVGRKVTDQSQNIESCVECSACSRKNIRQVFYIAQRSVNFPSLPLYDKTQQKLTERYERILRRVFRYFDRDGDRLWNAHEMNLFEVFCIRSLPIQKQCFSTQLSNQEIGSLLYVLRDAGEEVFVRPLPSTPSVQELPPEGFTEEGFLEMMRLFLRKDRPESNWVMLRSMG